MNPSEIIDALGGTFRVAELCEVRPPSVSDWRKQGIPKARLMFLRIARPEVFEVLDGQPEKKLHCRSLQKITQSLSNMSTEGYAMLLTASHSTQATNPSRAKLAPTLNATVRSCALERQTVDTPVQPSSTAQASA